MNDAEPLIMWTVYDHPNDYPDEVVAREWHIVKGVPIPLPTDDVIHAPDLDTIRRVLAQRGLVCVPREARDDRYIVEVWL
jgi:hypothetical protein